MNPLPTVMSTGRIYPIEVLQYADFTLPITWQNSEGVVDVTNYTAHLEVKDSGGSLVTDLSTSNGKITIATDGTFFTLVLTAAQTTALPVGAYSYDLLVTSGSGFKTRLLEGTFSILAGVTPS